MTEDLSPLEMIRANADLVLREARENLGQDVGYDEAGVRWLDGYIQRRHDSGAVGDDPSGLTNTLGSFLGECIAQSYKAVSVHAENGDWYG